MLWKVLTDSDWRVSENMYTSRTAAVAEYTSPWGTEYPETRTLELWVETTSGRLTRLCSWYRSNDAEISVGEQIAYHESSVEEEANLQSWHALDLEAKLRGERLRY